MPDFSLDSTAIENELRSAQHAGNDVVENSLAAARRGGGLSCTAMAALWFASRIDSEALYQIALATHRARALPPPTGSPATSAARAAR